MGEAESVTAATMRRVSEEWEAPLRARLAAAEKVVEAARHEEGAKECANFPPGSAFNCCSEPDDGWATTHDPCLFCALAALDALSASSTDRETDG